MVYNKRFRVDHSTPENEGCSCVDGLSCREDDRDGGVVATEGILTRRCGLNAWSIRGKAVAEAGIEVVFVSCRGFDCFKTNPNHVLYPARFRSML